MKIFRIAWLLLFLFNIGYGQDRDTRYALIPYPAGLKPESGFFTITPETKISIPPGQLFKEEAGILNRFFENCFGKPLMIADQKQAAIHLVSDPTITDPEGYRLGITGSGVILSAKTSDGMFMAIQTLRQLLPPSAEKPNGKPQTILSIPLAEIIDKPAYSWRGMHLDVSRHFFSISYLEKLLDLMALYKLNKFHLHLTDDQGWRIEIKKYPKLVEQGAWRTFNRQDSSCIANAKENPDFNIDPSHIVRRDGKIMYGGFYTQKEMKGLVAYAAARHIDIIPEIDMPGHMMAAIDAYNSLSCDGKSVFGELFSSPICPCMPATVQFAKDIFTEIMDIFPSQYIHIGGDEVDRSYWEKSKECQELMKKEGLKSTAEIQAWFINDMEKFFNARGRKLIGWDEILEGGISQTATIMYWRNWVPKAPVDAARKGNKVVMASLNPLYFSHPPDKNSLSEVYEYNPLPVELADSDADNIIGGQACLWTERVPSEKRADYLLMPRMTALAENLWSRGTDFKSYLRRLKNHYARLDRLKVNYRLPDLPVLENYVFIDKTKLAIEKPLDNLIIRYTIDSTMPDLQSKILTGSLEISQPVFIRIAAFNSNNVRGDVYDLHYQQQNYADPVSSINAVRGLSCSWYKKRFTSTVLMNDADADGSVLVRNIIVPKEAEAPSFGLRFRGYFDAPEDGIYTFYLTCDDGAVLTIAGREVVNNDGFHPPLEKNGQVALKKGLHKLALDFIEGGGGYTLKLQYSKDGSEPMDIPAEWLKHENK